MNEKYVAMDVHKASVAIGIRDSGGNYIQESIVETKAVTLLELVKGLSGTIHLTFEEGTQSAWLYDLQSRRPVAVDPPATHRLPIGQSARNTLPTLVRLRATLRQSISPPPPQYRFPKNVFV